MLIGVRSKKAARFHWDKHGTRCRRRAVGRIDVARFLFVSSVAFVRATPPLHPTSRCGSQCVLDLEKRFNTTTPATIKPMPMIAGASRCCPKNSHAISEISTMPAPDQIA